MCGGKYSRWMIVDVHTDVRECCSVDGDVLKLKTGSSCKPEVEGVTTKSLHCKTGA
jgi:hypothetical protein